VVVNEGQPMVIEYGATETKNIESIPIGAVQGVTDKVEEHVVPKPTAFLAVNLYYSVVVFKNTAPVTT
jgi:hypothetical protein